jgi:xanthine dehydrogenase YagS FAD-binding subunit
MRPFAYARATTVDEALAVSAEAGTVVLAGGTELLNWMRLGVAAPERVLDISRVSGLDQIESLPGGGLRIGAAARLNDVAADPRVRGDWPLLRQAIHKAASAQLRNLATIGGNLLQKTRCAYFRAEEPVPCNRREPGSGCAALRGRNDRHALFGWTEDCVAVHPADPAVALTALDAEVVTRGPNGGRRIGVRELHVLPDDRTDVDTVLEPGELIAALELPAPAPHSAYVKVRDAGALAAAMSAANLEQLIGIGEISHHDEHLGRWTSKNLAGVALPVNADIPSEIDVAFVEEVDEHASPIGGNGIGELGATGVDAAVADAVFHATGRRIRDLPITPDKLV